MAIYHLTVSVISRARGQRIVATAASRSGTKLFDMQYGVTHNHTRDHGVTHAEILVPDGAPPWAADRETLWNRVEARELRKDSQLARSVEIGLPLELTTERTIALLREYIAQEFVSKGMIADLSIRRTNPQNPQAHILLTLREPTLHGFGPKVRQWNRKTNLLDWRAAWSDLANRHLARAGHTERIDHRTLDAQQIDLAPMRRIGIGTSDRNAGRLPGHMDERLSDLKRIAAENGMAILGDPSLAVRALAQQRKIFGRDDIESFLRPRTEDAAQFEAALAAVLQSGELVAIAPADQNPMRYTSRDMLEAEKSLRRRAAVMASRRGHAGIVGADRSENADLHYVLSPGDFRAIAAAPAEKISLLAEARRAWEAAGLRVLDQGDAALTQDDVLVIDGAEMIELKQLERLLSFADRARAKVVLIGDEAELSAMGPVSPLSQLIDLGRT